MTDLDLYDEYLAALDRMILADTEEEYLVAERQATAAKDAFIRETNERMEAKLRSIK